ncbi:hypothetical protein Bbelb_057680 [Branchiostoma belcheri]|nr:hypothetical protein Bbelb_057680 [Branchiostoma belcheri]
MPRGWAGCGGNIRCWRILVTTVFSKPTKRARFTVFTTTKPCGVGSDLHRIQLLEIRKCVPEVWVLAIRKYFSLKIAQNAGEKSPNKAVNFDNVPSSGQGGVEPAPWNVDGPGGTRGMHGASKQDGRAGTDMSGEGKGGRGEPQNTEDMVLTAMVRVLEEDWLYGGVRSALAEVQSSVFHLTQLTGHGLNERLMGDFLTHGLTHRETWQVFFQVLQSGQLNGLRRNGAYQGTILKHGGQQALVGVQLSSATPYRERLSKGRETRTTRELCFVSGLLCARFVWSSLVSRCGTLIEAGVLIRCPQKVPQTPWIELGAI